MDRAIKNNNKKQFVTNKLSIFRLKNDNTIIKRLF